MARKTNKTAHVLNLLSSGTNEESVEEVVNAEEKDTPSTSSTSSNVQVSDGASESSIQLSDAIKESLSKEIGEPSSDKDKNLASTENEPVYVYINVLEYLVNQKIDEFMTNFNTCKCSRCEQDIKALTLSNLPSKYMVVAKEDLTPLIDTFGNRYQGEILSELTKSCLKVINDPRH